MQGYNRSLSALGKLRGHQQDLGADRHVARRRGAAGRLHRRREARSRGARGALAGWRASSTGWPARCSTARARCPPTPSATSRGSRPPRSTSPPTSRTSSSTIPSCPRDLRERIRSWLDENAADERKSGDTDEQFYYKARKKAIGPFKRELWALPEDIRTAIAADLERTFAFLFEQLNVNGTADHVNRSSRPRPAPRGAQAGAGGGRRRPRRRGIGDACASQGQGSRSYVRAVGRLLRQVAVLGRGARRRAGAAVCAAQRGGDPPRLCSAGCGSCGR